MDGVQIGQVLESEVHLTWKLRGESVTRSGETQAGGT